MAGSLRPPLRRGRRLEPLVGLAPSACARPQNELTKLALLLATLRNGRPARQRSAVFPLSAGCSAFELQDDGSASRSPPAREGLCPPSRSALRRGTLRPLRHRGRRLADGAGIAPTQPGGSLGFRDRGITALPTIRNCQGGRNQTCLKRFMRPLSVLLSSSPQSKMVESVGSAPTSTCLQGRCITCLPRPMKIGRLLRAVRSELSFGDSAPC